jgi:hypothetical protein
MRMNLALLATLVGCEGEVEPYVDDSGTINDEGLTGGLQFDFSGMDEVWVSGSFYEPLAEETDEQALGDCEVYVYEDHADAVYTERREVGTIEVEGKGETVELMFEEGRYRGVVPGSAGDVLAVRAEFGSYEAELPAMGLWVEHDDGELLWTGADADMVMIVGLGQEQSTTCFAADDGEFQLADEASFTGATSVHVLRAWVERVDFGTEVVAFSVTEQVAVEMASDADG